MISAIPQHYKDTDIPKQDKASLFEYVGGRIRIFRTGHGGDGLSQEELAKAIDVATNTISRWETATYQPSLEDLDRLARYFGKSILDFFPQENVSRSDQLGALLRAAEDLPEDDIQELQRYAEYRRARHVFGATKASGGRRKSPR
jgi:transcriptional regulator with XRE-family HTH domain